jgi:hypothetical protein
VALGALGEPAPALVQNARSGGCRLAPGLGIYAVALFGLIAGMSIMSSIYIYRLLFL